MKSNEVLKLKQKPVIKNPPETDGECVKWVWWVRYWHCVVWRSHVTFLLLVFLTWLLFHTCRWAGNVVFTSTVVWVRWPAREGFRSQWTVAGFTSVSQQYQLSLCASVTDNDTGLRRSNLHWKAGKASVVRWQVKLCDPLVTHRPHLSALD